MKPTSWWQNFSPCHFRSLSAELRAQIRSGITGLTSRPATAVPVLGDETRRILGVKEDSDNDSAIEDPNTESMKSKQEGRREPLIQPQVFSVTSVSRPRLSPPTKLTTLVPGISQLGSSKSPGAERSQINEIILSHAFSQLEICFLRLGELSPGAPH